jgi:hypothetical protein
MLLMTHQWRLTHFWLLVDRVLRPRRTFRLTAMLFELGFFVTVLRLQFLLQLGR